MCLAAPAGDARTAAAAAYAHAAPCGPPVSLASRPLAGGAQQALPREPCVRVRCFLPCSFLFLFFTNFASHHHCDVWICVCVCVEASSERDLFSVIFTSGRSVLSVACCLFALLVTQVGSFLQRCQAVQHAARRVESAPDAHGLA